MGDTFWSLVAFVFFVVVAVLLLLTSATLATGLGLIAIGLAAFALAGAPWNNWLARRR